MSSLPVKVKVADVRLVIAAGAVRRRVSGGLMSTPGDGLGGLVTPPPWFAHGASTTTAVDPTQIRYVPGRRSGNAVVERRVRPSKASRASRQGALRRAP